MWILCTILFLFCITAALSQTADWHFTWDESKQWNNLRKQKIEYAKSLARGANQSVDSLDMGGTEGSNLIGGLPIYVSLTTIANRLHLLSPTIQSIVSGSVVPTMIYVFISTDPHLIDTGIQESDFMDEAMKLVQLLDYFHNIKFVYTENIGPHRKVLPLLHHKWEEDCVIISVDDDHIYLHHWLRDMLAYYVHSKGQAIISTRARRIAICSGQSPYHIAPYMHPVGNTYHTQWYEAPPHVHEMLLLPTGVGGVLYRPRFFNRSVAFSRELFALTLRADDLTFRLATLANGISVYTACVHGDFKDHRLITKCPSLPGVSFQHIARRRLHGEEDGSDVDMAEDEGNNESRRYLRAEGGFHRQSGHLLTATGAEGRSLSSGHVGANLFRHRSGRRKRENAPIPWVRHLHENNVTVSPVAVPVLLDVPSAAVQHDSAAAVGSTAVYNRSKLQLTANLKPPAKNIDHGKQGSLSSINSKHDGNFHQWNRATDFLRSRGLFDVDAFLQSFVVQERRACVTTSLLLNYDNTTWTGSIVGSLATQLQLLRETWRTDRCGVVTCHRR